MKIIKKEIKMKKKILFLQIGEGNDVVEHSVLHPVTIHIIDEIVNLTLAAIVQVILKMKVGIPQRTAHLKKWNNRILLSQGHQINLKDKKVNNQMDHLMTNHFKMLKIIQMTKKMQENKKCKILKMNLMTFRKVLKTSTKEVCNNKFKMIKK